MPTLSFYTRGVYTPYMSIKRKKRNGRVYLEEHKSVRVDGKVKSIFVRYIGPENEIKKGKMPKRRVLDRIQMSRSTRAGDVRLLWQIAQDLDFPGIIDRICCQESYFPGPSPGKFLTVWAINRIVDPESCTQLERWAPTTDLPLLTGIEPEFFNKEAFLSSLDFICYHDSKTQQMVNHTNTIDDTLYQHWRHSNPLPAGEKETVAYDLTSVLFFGVTCPLAEFGHKAKDTKCKQANLALLVSKYDKFPIAHFVYNGKRNTSSTVKNLIARMFEVAIEPGTIVWDRGNVSKDHVNEVESTGWNLICGVPKNSNEAREIINSTDVKIEPGTFVHKSKSDHIYAVKTRKQLFGKERSVVVYLNQERCVNKINDQNLALSEIGIKLNILGDDGKDKSEAELHKNIDSIVGNWKDYFHIRVKRKSNGPRIEWKYKKREVAKREKSYGKYLLLSTDESLSAEDIIKAYFEKDYIEKVFRTLKTTERIEPVRHRLDPRVRAYIFVCVLAYRLLSVLHFKIEKTKGKENPWEKSFDLLNNLSRVERTEVGFGKEVKIWYLNVTKEIIDSLKVIGMKDLLKEEKKLKV